MNSSKIQGALLAGTACSASVLIEFGHHLSLPELSKQ